MVSAAISEESCICLDLLQQSQDCLERNFICWKSFNKVICLLELSLWLLISEDVSGFIHIVTHVLSLAE